MLFEPLLGTALSGKLGGIVASHNAGGTYFRAFVIPTDPSSPAQNQIRNAVTNLTSRWVNILTPVQRDLWEVYAANVTLVNRIGNPINISGLSQYVRSNVPRSQEAALSRINGGPVVFDLGEFTAPTMAVATGTQLITVTFDDTDAWAGEDESAMMVYASRPQNQTVNFFKSPYRFAGALLGNTAVPLTSPQTIPVPFPVIAGQRVHLYVRVTRADARLSGKNLIFADVT